MPFQLTAQLNLNPQILNLQNIQKQVRSALSGIGPVNVQVNLPASAINKSNRLNQAMAQIKANALVTSNAFNGVTNAVNKVNSSLQQTHTWWGGAEFQDTRNACFGC